MPTHRSYCLWCGNLVGCTGPVLDIRGLCQPDWPQINFCSRTCYKETLAAMEEGYAHMKNLAKEPDNDEARAFLER